MIVFRESLQPFFGQTIMVLVKIEEFKTNGSIDAQAVESSAPCRKKTVGC